MDSTDLWNSVQEILGARSNLDAIERWLTTFVFHANIIVVFGERRRFSWIVPVEIVTKAPMYLPQVTALFDGAAERLEMGEGRKELYLFYRKFFSRKSVRAQGGQGDAIVPFKACGFATLGAMRKADLKEYGTALVEVGNQDAFATLATIVRLSDEQVMRECLPHIVADIVLKVLLFLTT